MPGWLDSAPDPDAGADAAHRPAPGRQLRGLAALGRRPQHRLLPVPTPARPLPLPDLHASRAGAAPPSTHTARPRPARTRSTDDRRHDPVPRRPPHHREQGHGLRAGRPQPRPRRQRHGRASARSAAARSTSTRACSRTPVARRSTDSSRTRRSSAPTPSSRCASTVRDRRAHVARSSPTAPPSSSSPTTRRRRPPRRPNERPRDRAPTVTAPPGPRLRR